MYIISNDKMLNLLQSEFIVSNDSYDNYDATIYYSIFCQLINMCCCLLKIVRVDKLALVI